MRRKLIVVFPVLENHHRVAIRTAAEDHGFDVFFFDRDQDAVPFVSDAEIIFAHSPFLAGKAPVLRWMCTPFAGVDQFQDQKIFAAPDVLLSNSSGAYGLTIAEHIVMVILETLRRAPDYQSIVSRREWFRDLPVRSIKGSRITFLGTGDIGRESALRLKAFIPDRMIGVNRSGLSPSGLFDRVVSQSDLDLVLPETDILIISLPGTPATAGLISAHRLSLLPDRALIVNVGRGSVLDQDALISELWSNRLCAALDVFEHEPLSPEDPVWSCPNLLITPHIAGNTTLPYTRDRIIDLFLEDFENYCSGRPLLRQVDLNRGY